MIKGVGFDLVEVARMEKLLENKRFLERCFTEAEIEYIRSRGNAAAQSLAGHFAAKEAGLKALGCGIAMPLTQIAVEHDAFGAPAYRLTGKAREQMLLRGGSAMYLSITHTDKVAGAVAVLEG